MYQFEGEFRCSRYNFHNFIYFFVSNKRVHSDVLRAPLATMAMDAFVMQEILHPNISVLIRICAVLTPNVSSCRSLVQVVNVTLDLLAMASDLMDVYHQS